MGCKQLWYQHAFHVKQRRRDMWCVCMCCLAHFHGGVCYPCLLESNLRLCLIGVFTLSGLTRTDTFDLGSSPFAMKRENNDTDAFLPLLGWEAKLYFSFSFPMSSAPVICFRRLSSLHLNAWTFRWRDLRGMHEGHNSQHLAAAGLILLLNYMCAAHSKVCVFQ